MTRHVGAAALARYREGDLSGRRTSRIRAHLAGCPRCTALDEDLAGVSVMLASAPVPAMPEQVTARISAALTAAAARPARLGAGQQAGQPGHSRHASGRPGPGRRWRLPELLSPVAVRAVAVAAAAAVLAGGVYGAVQLAGGPAATGAGSTASAGGISGPAAAPQHAAAGTGPPLTYTRAGHPAQFTPVSTGRDFQPALLKSQVRSLLARSAGPRQPVSGPRASTTHPGAKRGIASGSASGQAAFGGIRLAALQGCVTRISAGRQVLLVDVDRYQGKPATIIVVGGGAGGPRAWVVGPGCSRSDSDVIAQASLAGAG
jgi:Putative zinc-finger